MKLPVTAIIPVYNCRNAFERHLVSVKKWAGSVEEIIIIDSGSTDGTLELASGFADGFGAKLLSNPPGLYASWNAGINAASFPWCYISTVEDPISPEGLSHLFQVASADQPDVVISPPRIMSADGSVELEWEMPSNRVANALLKSGKESITLSRSESIALFCGCLPGGLLGSSASNLYRTEFLKKHNFPTDFGRAGDTAWGISVCNEVRVAVTTKKCAMFYAQTSHAEESPNKRLENHIKLSELAIERLSLVGDKNSESSIMKGWFESYNTTQKELLDWLIRENKYKILLEEIKKKYQVGFWKFVEMTLREKAYRLMHGKQ